MKPFARRLLQVATILFLAAPTVTRADCPLNRYRFGAGPPVESSAPTQSFSFGSPGSCNSGNASWDLSGGKLALALQPCTRDSAECRIRDTFVLHGPPPGTQLNVFIYLEWNTFSTEPCGLNSCQVKHTIVLSAGARTDSSTYFDPFGGVTSVVFFKATVGQPFDVTAKLAIESPEGGEGHANGDLRFIVQGGTLTSCNNYNEQPTPATQTSWGRLRAAYR